MIRALFKKQMMESFSWLYFSRRTGKKRSAGGIAAYTCMYLVIFGMLGSLFYTMAEALCRPLSEVGLGWLYFAIVSLVAVIFGVFGSAFNTFASLYKAKDNDLLFSMPIPASKILLTRLYGVYAMGLMYELIVLIPSLCVWIRRGFCQHCRHSVQRADAVCSVVFGSEPVLRTRVCSGAGQHQGAK